MRLRFLSTLALVLLCPWSALAQDGFYAELAPGVSFVGDTDLSGGGLSATAELDPGFVIGGAIGYELSDSLRTELNVSYREQDFDKLDGGGLGSLDGVGDIGTTTIMANGIYDIEVDFPITPYIGAGIGLAVVEVDSDESGCAVCIDDSDVQFAWNLMVGGSTSVTESITLSAGYRYTGVTAPELQDEFAGVDIESDDPLDIHEIVFGLRYSF